MVMFALSSSNPFSATATATATAGTMNQNNTTATATASSTEATEHSSNDAPDHSFSSMAEFEDILMEAGYTAGDANRIMTDEAAAHNNGSILTKGSRNRTSSCGSAISVTDGYLQQQLRDQQRQQQMDNDDRSHTSITSHTDIDGSNHTHNNNTIMDLEAQMAPAPEHVCRGYQCCPNPHQQEAQDKLIILPQEQQQQQEDNEDNEEEEMEMPEPATTKNIMDHDDVPVIPLSSLRLLAKKTKKKVTATMTTTDNENNSISSASINDESSASSVRSLVSVVAELVAYPIKAFADLMADLNTELIASMDVPSRAQFISASIILLQSHQNSADSDEEDATAFTELGLRLDRCLSTSSGNEVVAVAEIDPNGYWADSPICVGDRIISINHTNVSQWQIEEVHEYWKTLVNKAAAAKSRITETGASTINLDDVDEDICVTMVVHNPSGEGQWVTAMITKPDPDTRTGLGMRSSRPGRVKISRVDGLFQKSLLNPGDQILSINGLGVHGYNSADTASVILKSPRRVTVLAKSDARGAFVIAANDNNNNNDQNDSAYATGTSLSRSWLALPEENNMATLYGHSSSSTMDQGGDDNLDDTFTGQRPVLDPNDRCDNCGCVGPWNTLKVLRWSGSLYVAFLFFFGVYACFINNTKLNMVMGVLVLTVVMGNMVYMTVRNLERQQRQAAIDKTLVKRCSLFQISSNIILLGAFTFLMMMWRNLEYSAITAEFVLIVLVVVLGPMLLFINMPSCCIIKPDREFDMEDFDEDLIDDVRSLEPHAVASLADVH